MSGLDDNDSSGLGARLRSALAGRVVWYADERRDAAGEPTRRAALVTLLGREHYVERRRSFPIHSRRDLEGVLRQELAGAPPTLTAISDLRDDRREVTFFEFKPEVLSNAGPCLWLVPESMALAATLPAGRVATVERRGYRYFVASTGVSQPAGGAVTNADLFALAAGLDASDGLSIADAGLHDRLVTGLARIPWSAWLRLRAPSLQPRLQLDWKPIVTLAGVGLLAYLALASGYLSLTERVRQREVAGLGGEVEKLLVAQHAVDRMLAEQAGLAAVMKDRRSSYRLWQVVAVALSKGASISNVQLQDSTLTLRGTAAVATDVLAAVDALPGFTDAKFSAPVRQNNSGREDFSLSLTMLPEADRG